jgi:hypothetical protein
MTEDDLRRLDPKADVYRAAYEAWNRSAQPTPLSWWKRIVRFWTQ